MEPRLFIIEGADGTGKTTLAKFIARKLGAAYFHATGHKSLHAAMPAYHHNILDNAKVCMEVSGISVVLDRHWPSEECYGRTLRFEKFVTSAYSIGEMFAKATTLKAMHVFCFSDTALMRQCANPDPTHPYTMEQYKKVYEEYLRVAKHMWSDTGCYLYNLEQSGSNLDKVLDEILKFPLTV